MVVVVYNNYRVSDDRVRDALQAIADTVGRVVRVTSGNRGHVPSGGATNSLHLLHQAADFHCDGFTDEQAFGLIRTKRKEIFGDERGASFRYQIIYHGPYTETQGSHLHLGWVPAERTRQLRGFVVEGLTQITRGKYDMVEAP